MFEGWEAKLRWYIKVRMATPPPSPGRGGEERRQSRVEPGHRRESSKGLMV
jgi:hypothetical protein